MIEVSFVIPVYNSERTLFKCLESITNSNFPEEKREIILVDNNSTDEGLLVAKRFPVKIIKEPRQGRSYARNKGASVAQGEYLFFLDADAYIEDDYIDEVLEVLGKSDVGGVQGKIIPSDIDGQASINEYRYKTIESATDGTFCLLNLMVRESPMINSAACAYRKIAFDRVGGFDEELERHEDIDLARRVCYSGYLLASAEKAAAHVIYHGEGWASYFWRSFLDGFTKIDYNRKWSLPVEWLGLEDDHKLLSEDESVASLEKPAPKKRGFKDNRGRSKSKKKKNFNKLNYVIWALKDLISALVGLIRNGDIFYLYLFINVCMKLLGRVLGPLRRRRHFKRVTINAAPAQVRIKKVKLKGDRLLTLKPSLRFVLLQRHLYLVDTDGHVILSDDHNYPYFFSYPTFHNLGLFEEFSGGDDKDMIFEILQYKELLLS